MRQERELPRRDLPGPFGSGAQEPAADGVVPAGLPAYRLGSSERNTAGEKHGRGRLFLFLRGTVCVCVCVVLIGSQGKPTGNRPQLAQKNHKSNAGLSK